ncbi:MAG TPA: hypothetical protein VNI57_13725, partial [Candidatus Saccharimonadales bacterium]|nr:hypothetical protein [Candidatus Saccharimonadales bacterium]
AIAAAAVSLLRPAPTAPVIVSAIPAPEGDTFVTTAPAIALSPDGSRIAFVARGPSGTGLWVEPLATGRPALAESAEDIDCPFWSPDSRSIGFRSGGQLKKLDIASGQSDVLAPMSECLGASWGSDRSILYVASKFSTIMKVPESGGTPIAIDIAGARAARVYSQPSLLPDGRHILYSVNQSYEGRDESGIFVATIDGKDEKRLIDVLSNAYFVQPGYIVYARNGALRAQKFDARSLEISVDPIGLLDGVQYVGYYQSHLFSISGGGLLAYSEGKGVLTRQLTWVDRKGTILGTVGTPGNYFSPRISHDGKRIAYDQSEATTDSGDIWVLDLERGIPTRLTFDPRNESAPLWSPDDSRILFFANLAERTDLFTIPSDGTGKAETLLSNGAINLPTDWSMDGKSILIESSAASGVRNIDLFVYSFDEKKASPWLATPFTEQEARFSLDGRWIAYDSDESGRMEVYVRGFSPPGGKWRVSSDGGSAPVWSRDGKVLLYLSHDAEVMSVALGAGTTFEGGTPAPLFKIPGTLLNGGVVAQYDVSPDGGRFLMNLESPSPGQKTITLVSNWSSLLKKN